jgi:small conductance mechanosensitive channel
MYFGFSIHLATCVIILGVVIAFNILGLNGADSEILAGIRITGFIISFAFKNIGENFIAGVILAFKLPFDMEDIIETNGLKGSVIYLTLRETTIKTFDGKDIFVPNGLILKQPLQNYSKDNLLHHDFSIGVDYTTMKALTRQLMQKMTQEKKYVMLQEGKPG